MFSLDKMERLANEEAGDNAKRVGLCFNNLQKEVDKVVKFVFKTCFLGNETFHDKLFGRRKECDYENFSFEAAGLDEGCSSYSEYSGCSDMEDRDRSESRADKKQKKLVVAQQKIRFNSVSLLSHVFKQYPSLVETHWELCVTPNILTAEFLAYLRKLTLSSGSSKLNAEEKQEIVTLMRTNFGDHSLILLAVFERSSKVKLQAVECLLNMLANFQGKKLIDTTESTYIEKLLKSTRSSFVPKSFIIFSGLRNALYFLLFSLHYEKNVQVVVSVFTALAELCRNSTLIEKMPFEEGVGLLMANYISPVLDLDWQLPQLT